jgi:hypothetical protein
MEKRRFVPMLQGGQVFHDGHLRATIRLPKLLSAQAVNLRQLIVWLGSFCVLKLACAANPSQGYLDRWLKTRIPILIQWNHGELPPGIHRSVTLVQWCTQVVFPQFTNNSTGHLLLYFH